MENRKQYRSLDAAKFVCAILIIILHTGAVFFLQQCAELRFPKYYNRCSRTVLFYDKRIFAVYKAEHPAIGGKIIVF